MGEDDREPSRWTRCCRLSGSIGAGGARSFQSLVTVGLRPTRAGFVVALLLVFHPLYPEGQDTEAEWKKPKNQGEDAEPEGE